MGHAERHDAPGPGVAVNHLALSAILTFVADAANVLLLGPALATALG